jgi:acetyl esterase/lipase
MSEPRSIAYGTHQAQYGELSVPDRSTHNGTVVIVHGGFWRARYDLSLGRPLAADLVRHGFTCWNIEYRRVGDGGGWPGTVRDVAAAIDHLSALDVDTERVVAIGHSAGGHLAVWAAGRPDAGVPLAAAVSQAGVLDLRGAEREHLGRGAVREFLGGTSADVPQRYRDADPLAAVPLAVPVLCVHARADVDVPYSQSTRYVAAATEAGGAAALLEVPGDHFSVIDPSDPSWTLVRDALPALLAGRLP